MKRWKEYFFLTLAACATMLGIYFFKFPNNYSFGGASGMAVVLSAVTSYSAGSINLFLNVAMLVLGFLLLGKQFGLKTAYVSLFVSVGLKLMERIVPLDQPLTNEPLLELVFAVAVPALGAAILFNIGASSGGTDILAMILKKYTRISDIGMALFLVDLVVVISACFVFDVKTGLFSFIGLLMKSIVIDDLIDSMNLSKYMTIVCDEPEPICEYIHKNLNRGATIMEGKGSYAGKKKYIVLTVMKKRQAVELERYIQKNELNAFIMVVKSSEIFGSGFHSV